MPQYFKIFNALPSFDADYVRTESGPTFANPYANYGVYGGHIEDYFHNRMRETPAGGSDNLKVFLTTQAGMTTMVASGLTTALNYIYTEFGATADTVGYGLLDFRGSDSWNIITGDGIIGQSNANSLAYSQSVSAASQILDYFSENTQIKWAYLGLPYLPQVTTYAPLAGTSHSWNTSLINTGTTSTNYWDNDHPKISEIPGYIAPMYPHIFMWASTPENLQDYYIAKSVDSVLPILDSSGWLCPDLVPIDTHMGVSRVWFTVDKTARYTRSLIDVSNDYANIKQETNPERIEIYPFISSMHRSRTVLAEDDPSGVFYSGDGVIINSGFSGHTQGSSESLIKEAIFKSGMVEPAALNYDCNGFVYLDQIPFAIDLACSVTVTGNSEEQVAQSRSRRLILTQVYSNQNPITDDISINQSFFNWPSVSDEVTSYLSYNIAPRYLRYISESIPVGSDRWPTQISLVGNVTTGDGSSYTVAEYDSGRWSGSFFGYNQNAQLFSQNLYNEIECCLSEGRELCCIQPRVGDGSGLSASYICMSVPEGECVGNYRGTVLNVEAGESCRTCLKDDPNNFYGFCCVPGRGCRERSRYTCASADGKLYTTLAQCLANCDNTYDGGVLPGDGDSLGYVCNCNVGGDRPCRETSCNPYCSARSCPGVPGYSCYHKCCCDDTPENKLSAVLKIQGSIKVKTRNPMCQCRETLLGEFVIGTPSGSGATIRGYGQAQNVTTTNKAYAIRELNASDPNNPGCGQWTQECRCDTMVIAEQTLTRTAQIECPVTVVQWPLTPSQNANVQSFPTDGMDQFSDQFSCLRYTARAVQLMSASISIPDPPPGGEAIDRSCCSPADTLSCTALQYAEITASVNVITDIQGCCNAEPVTPPPLPPP